MNKCPDCGKAISARAQRCSSCAMVHRWAMTERKPPKTCLDCGTTISRNKAKRCNACATKQGWANPETRAKLIAKLNRPEEHLRRSEFSKALWQVEGHRDRVSRAMQRVWADPERRERAASSARVTSSKPERVERFKQRTADLWADPEFSPHAWG